MQISEKEKKHKEQEQLVNNVGQFVQKFSQALKDSFDDNDWSTKTNKDIH